MQWFTAILGYKLCNASEMLMTYRLRHKHCKHSPRQVLCLHSIHQRDSHPSPGYRGNVCCSCYQGLAKTQRQVWIPRNILKMHWCHESKIGRAACQNSSLTYFVILWHSAASVQKVIILPYIRLGFSEANQFSFWYPFTFIYAEDKVWPTASWSLLPT
jgi:hypothetical protein